MLALIAQIVFVGILGAASGVWAKRAGWLADLFEDVPALEGPTQVIARSEFDWGAHATRMWLDDPSAFFLHPEGPLSDKTPAQWLAEQASNPMNVPAATIRQGNRFANYENFQGFTRVPGSARIERVVNDDGWMDGMTDEEIDALADQLGLGTRV